MMTTDFIICHRKYLEITGNRCAAELLHFFKSYKPSRKDGWLIITLKELKEKLLDTWGRDAIRTGIKLLDNLGLIERDHPRLNKRAWMYKFVADVVENPTTVVENPTTVDENPTTTIYKDPNKDPFLTSEKEQPPIDSPEPIQVDSTNSRRINSNSTDPTPKNTYGQSNLTGPIIRSKRESFSKTLNWDWIPEGPWKIDGKLDSELIDWQARRWLLKGWGLDIHEARKKIRAYYKNDPTRLANDWQEYQEAIAHKLANLALREKHGTKVSVDEKQQVAVQIQRAFQPNPHSYTTPNTGEIEKYKQWLELEVESGQPMPHVSEEKAIASRKIYEIPEGAENPQAYKESVSQEDRDWAVQFHLRAKGGHHD